MPVIRPAHKTGAPESSTNVRPDGMAAKNGLKVGK